MSSPTTVRNPARLSSSSSIGFSFDKTPISRRSLGPLVEIAKAEVREDQKELMVRAWDIVSKSRSMYSASLRCSTLFRHDLLAAGHF